MASANPDKAVREAVWGLCMGDSMAMPVHWFYNPNDIKRIYKGWLTGYVAPSTRHPTSILSVSNIYGSGRASAKQGESVIGNIILHDKLSYWTSSKRDIHYHQGMSAGDNTLNAVTALMMMKTMQDVDCEHSMAHEVLLGRIMEEYVKFMTTPNTHNDTYAESFHRMFFAHWAFSSNRPTRGEDIVKSARDRYSKITSRNEDGQLPSIGAIPVAIPWILHYVHLSLEECEENVADALKLTHPAPSLLPYIKAYTKLLHGVIHGGNLQQLIEETQGTELFGGSANRKRMAKIQAEASMLRDSPEEQLEFCQDMVHQIGAACYIYGSLPSMMFLAHVFHDNIEKGLLMNANCGGENVHRGAALGALLAANSVAINKPIPQKLKDGLNSAKPMIVKIVNTENGV